LVFFLAQKLFLSSSLFIFIEAELVLLVFERDVDFVFSELIHLPQELFGHVVHFCFDVDFDFV